MTTFGDYDLDPEKAAQGIGDILSVLRSSSLEDGPNNMGIGNTSMSTNAKTTTEAGGAPMQGDVPGGHVSPVPEGTAVSQPFGAGNAHESTHPGVDLAVPLDTQLLAAANGKVTQSGNNDPGGYGNMVEITTPDGFVLRYGHMHGMNVKVGDTVRAGQVIGTSGGEAGGAGAGNSTGAHLHFEVQANGHPVDPTPFLAGGYQILGGQGPSVTTTTADPQAIAAVQLQNVINVLGGDPLIDTTPPEQPTSPDQKATDSTADNDPGAVDAFLGAIKQKESGGNYTIRNTSGLSNAAGAYQFIGTTWQGLGGSTASAAEASPAEQDRIARKYALDLFKEFGSWRLVALAWYGGPGVAEQARKGADPGAPAGQGRYLDYANSIVASMSGGK